MVARLAELPEQTEVCNYFVSNYPPYSRWSADQVPTYELALASHANTGPLGLYVHVPFCRQRCTYCYFRVHTRRPDDVVDAYVDAVLAELALYGETPAVGGRPIANAYFGGGTPTHLSSEQIRRFLGGLRQRLDWSKATEVTYECQPGTVDAEKMNLLKAMGVTRASLGVQTFSDDVLRGVGRAAGTRDCLEAYDLARHAGFDHVNLDLMAGLPGETDASWQQTIDRVAELQPDCVTIYQFELTHNSALYRSMKNGRQVLLADWPTKRRWVSEAFDRLTADGYTIYGAYWAVRDPRTHRYAYVTDHYWRGHDLLALGESAFGYLAAHHYQNVDTLDAYVDAATEGRLPLQRAYHMSEDERLRRQFILQLKTGMVALEPLRDEFGETRVSQLLTPLAELRDHGILDYDQQGVFMSREGLLCIDWLLPRFYLPEHQGVRYT